jgi:hypothetical protein
MVYTIRHPSTRRRSMRNVSIVPALLGLCLFGLVACGSAGDGTEQSVEAATTANYVTIVTNSHDEDYYLSFGERSVGMPFPLPPGDLNWNDFWGSWRSRVTYKFDGNKTGADATLTLGSRYPLNGTDNVLCEITMSDSVEQTGSFAAFTPAYWDLYNKSTTRHVGSIKDISTQITRCRMAADDPQFGHVPQIFGLYWAKWIAPLGGATAASSADPAYVVLYWVRNVGTRKDSYHEFLTTY